MEVTRHHRMRAAVYRRYGASDVVQLEDAEKPVPENNEILVRVHATTVCAADWRLRKADPFIIARLMNGLLRPTRINILGMEFAGTIEQMGENATRFSVGDHIFGSTGFKFGAHAEYVCISQDRQMATIPNNASPEEAAAISFGGISALHFLRSGKIQAGQKALIYGASGSVGTFAVQLAKHFGAHVTGVCSTANLELVKSLGADKVVDYTREDFSAAGRVYDFIYDTVGKSGFWRCMNSLKQGGCYILAGPGLASVLGGVWATITGAGKVIGGVARSEPGDLSFLKELIEAGEIRPVIDRCYPLEEIAEAHRYVEAGHKKGNVVITLEKRDRV